MKLKMSILILVRHGQSIYNVENRFTGTVDIGLTQLGKAESHEAGKKLINYKFNFAFTSTLIRAQKSLVIILNEINQPNIDIIEDKALNERDYGSLQGLNKAETATKYGSEQVEIWRRSFDICPPGGESLKDTFDRVIPFYKENIESKLKENKNILIVAHGNSLRALVMYLEKINELDVASLNIPTGIPKKYIIDENLNILEFGYL